MTLKKDIRLSIWMDKKTKQMLEELQDMTSLSKAAIFRLALMNFYKQNINQEGINLDNKTNNI